MSRYGRFTVRGGPAVEHRIEEVVDEIAAIMGSEIPESDLRSVVLFGGYGRGEGGVETREEEEHPHNNLDFLVITRGIGRRRRRDLGRRLNQALEPLSRSCSIGIDVGVIADRTLRNAPCRVMWYDMRYGHKPILGDPDFVGALDRFRVERILPSDVRDLLVNRGTLLVINDLILDRPALTEDERRTVVKHAVKAVIGYGDALLFFLGDYHWSYLERQRRMATSYDLPEALRDQYDEAMEFRFQPDYTAWADRDLAEWMAALTGILQPAHLEVERRRLRCEQLGWESYPEETLARGMVDVLGHPKELARTALALIRSRSCPVPGPRLARLGWRLASPGDQLALVFPVVAYGLADPRLRELAGRVLQTRGTGDSRLRRAYLEAWGRYADVNFASVAQKLGISVGDWGET